MDANVQRAKPKVHNTVLSITDNTADSYFTAGSGGNLKQRDPLVRAAGSGKRAAVFYVKRLSRMFNNVALMPLSGSLT